MLDLDWNWDLEADRCDYSCLSALIIGDGDDSRGVHLSSVVVVSPEVVWRAARSLWVCRCRERGRDLVSVERPSIGMTKGAREPDQLGLGLDYLGFG